MAHGYAPYEEAALQGQHRVSLMQRLGQIFAGAGAGLAAAPQNAGGLESLATGFAGGYGQANAARQAAEAYAMKKIEAERQAEDSRLQRLNIESQIQARAKEPAPKDETPWYLKPPWKGTPEGEAARKKAEYIAGEQPKGSPSNILDMTPKQFEEYLRRKKLVDQAVQPEKPRAAVQDWMDLIKQMDANNPEHRARLEKVIANPLTPEIGRAAQDKLKIGGREFYRYQPVGPDSSQTGGLRYR